MRPVRVVIALCAWLAASACVEAEPEPEMGEAELFSGTPLLDQNDYVVPVSPVASAGTSALTEPIAGEGAAGMAGMLPAAGTVAVPVAGSAASGTGGSAGSLPIAGTAPLAGMQAIAGEGAAGMEAPLAGAGGSAGTGARSGPGTLTVSVTTQAIGGRYQPRNYGAIWIETSSGQFVKTIERWAGIHVADLRAWNAASGGWGFSFFGGASSSPDAVDAVSSATARSHVAHNPSWAMKDGSGMVVPDGTYKVRLEVADGTAGTAELSFTKGPMAQTVSASGGRGYTSFTATYTP